jgi:hypothetical protein
VCGGVIKAAGLCNRCYLRQRRHGDPTVIANSERSRSSDGDELALRLILDELGTTDRYVVSWWAAIVVSWPPADRRD